MRQILELVLLVEVSGLIKVVMLIMWLLVNVHKQLDSIMDRVELKLVEASTMLLCLRLLTLRFKLET